MDVIPSALDSTSSPSLEVLTALEPGQEVFGRFTLLENLGSGRCSIAWRADDSRFVREVVLKVFQSSKSSPADEEQRIWREFLRGVRALNCPKIASAMEFLRDGDRIALSNPFVAGETLASQIRKAQKPLAMKDCQVILREVGEALVIAHEKGRIIHGNLNAFNILTKKDGGVKVTDFGFHPPLGPGFSGPEGKSDDLAWKLACVSPERLAGGNPSPADDTFAFAAIAFQLVTGSNLPAEEGEGRQEKLERVAHLSKTWISTLLAALSHDLADRPASLKILLRELNLSEEPFKQPAPNASNSSGARKRQPPQKSRPRNYAFIAALILSGILVPAGLAWLIHQGTAANEKLQADRVREETVELAGQHKILPSLSEAYPVSSPSTDGELAGKAVAAATPLTINSGANDFLREGEAKMKAGNPTGALESYDLALILQSNWPELNVARAGAFVATGQLQEALDEYNEALRLEPGRPSALLGRGALLLGAGQAEAARADFQAVLDAHPENADARAGLKQLSTGSDAPLHK